MWNRKCHFIGIKEERSDFILYSPKYSYLYVKNILTLFEYNARWRTFSFQTITNLLRFMFRKFFNIKQGCFNDTKTIYFNNTNINFSTNDIASRMFYSY